MATEKTQVGAVPKQKRGRERVEAILGAASELFVAKGWEASTMTEVAVRSGTAIASLYRFFPSKEALADALLERWIILARARLEQALSMPCDRDPAAAAAILVRLGMDIQSEKRPAIALMEARDADQEMRKRFRAEIAAGIASIVVRAVPGTSASQARLSALLLHGFFKGMSAMLRDAPQQKAALREMETFVLSYLQSLGSATGA